MQFPYTYKKTAQITELLNRLEIVKAVLEALPTQPGIEENLRRQSILKSSLFSARIEGNRLRLDQVTTQGLVHSERTREKLEIANILRAHQWIYSNASPNKLSLRVLLALHSKVMHNLSADVGKIRSEPSAIFNATGVAIYLTPPPSKIKPRLRQLIIYTNASSVPGPIRASVTHFVFEKIHPFLDGNGRVGRLLSTFILNRTSYDFRGLIAFEEELEKQRQEYYDLLAISTKNVTLFVEFYVRILLKQAEKAIEQVKTMNQEVPEDTLLPRRQEILNIIRDHHHVSFDFIHRRFFGVAKSTLHFDLKQLMKANLIKKLGATRGVVYVPK